MKLNATGVLALAGLAVGGYVVWRTYRGGQALVTGLTDAASQAAAEVQQRWNTITNGPQVPGDPVKAALYSDYGYSGIDPATGRSVIDGEWYGNEEARRYEYQQRDAGRAPAATSIDGAAFGVYPSAKRRAPPASNAPAGTPPATLPAPGYYTGPAPSWAAGESFETQSSPDWNPFAL